MKNDFVMPILVLALICVVISGALAFTNSVTEPIIKEAAAVREAEARSEIIPEADSFEDMPDIAGLPATVREVFRAKNDSGDIGYIFMVTTSGYGGDIKIICGIDNEGRLIHSKVLDHSETKGLGSRITEGWFALQFDGKESGFQDVDAISGATKSTNAYASAIRDAFEAFGVIEN